MHIGIKEPNIINNDCLEKNPAFLIVYLIKYIKATNSNKYE